MACAAPVISDPDRRRPSASAPWAWLALGSLGALLGCYSERPSVIGSSGEHPTGSSEFSEACSLCHGDATSPAPPKDTQGRIEETFRTVGAHRAHLEAKHRISAPVACNECHLVPEHLLSPGHLDSGPPAPVFPVGAGDLARADGANPTYNTANATCGSVYCHGAGTRASADAAPSLNRNPLWTGGTAQIACGACHGLPPSPATGAHRNLPPGDISRCYNCHADTVTPEGAIKASVDSTGQVTSTHINGKVEVRRP